MSAASRNPDFYQPKHALTAKSKVVITGVLNQLGFHLALALHHQCGVTQIFAIDTISPQNSQDRMDAIERYAILTKEIPNFQQITVPWVGLHPRECQQEPPFQIIHRFHPTHIVHLASFSEESQTTIDYLDNAQVFEHAQVIPHQLCIMIITNLLS